MIQETHNKVTVVISIVALILSIAFPFIKESYIDNPEIFNTSSKYLNLTHYFGNSSLGLNVNLINTGEKSTIITKIDVALFNAKNDLIIKPKEANLFTAYSTSPQNVIALNPKTEGSYNLYLQLNDVENEEANDEINKLNKSAIADLDKQGCTVNNYTLFGLNVQLCDSIYKKIENTCNKNLESLKVGDYKILYFIYQDGNNLPSIIFGKSFKITENNKEDILLSVKNYKWGSHLFNTNKILYSNGSNIRVYDLNKEDINILKEKVK